MTFRLLPGRSAEVSEIFREQALPLYERNEAMLSFRGFREVESPVALDLIVVSAFRGMAGMDDSNEALRSLAAERGTSIGGVYGSIAAASSGHDDQFVEMLAHLSHGDASDRPLVALVWYRLLPGEGGRFERTLGDRIVPWERETGTPSATGRFLVSDGWHYLRFLGFASLADYHAYWKGVDAEGHDYLDGITAVRREVIVAPVPELSVR
ncbi:MAG: hypothetical protein OEN56_00460 [Gemmatimonadota bacterium]|nr:hypothetical protein [Gemmatimonadota bacterium]